MAGVGSVNLVRGSPLFQWGEFRFSGGKSLSGLMWCFLRRDFTEVAGESRDDLQSKSSVSTMPIFTAYLVISTKL